MTKRTKCLAVLSVIWMALIFLLSSQTVDESNDFSNSFTRFLLNILEPGEHIDEQEITPEISSSNPETSSDSGIATEDVSISAGSFFGGGNSADYDPIPKNKWFGISPSLFKDKVRTAAHFVMFLGLGVLFACTLFSYFGQFKLRYAIYAWSGCVLYACLDEFHQLFVEGRGAQLTDVRTDSFGALIGVAIICLIYVLFDAYKRKKPYCQII